MIFLENIYIPILNGNLLNLKDWYYNKKDLIFYVYCYDEIKQKISYGMAFKIELKTISQNDEIYTIIYNNNQQESFGEEPQFIKENDKIKTLARRISSLNEKDELEGYEMFWEQSQDSWLYTHRMIAGDISENYVVHHIDKNKLNNNPTNLEIKSKNQHAFQHQIEKSFKEQTPDLFENFTFKKEESKNVFRNSKKQLDIIDILKQSPSSSLEGYSFKVYPYKNIALKSGAFVKV